jgi:hypothetical protein
MRPCFPAIAALAAFACNAPALAASEFRAGYGTWRYDITGTVTDRDRSYDLQRDLHLETSGRRSVLVEWDTPEGWLPDLAVTFSEVGGSGEAEYQSVSLDLLGNPIFGDETITASADFDDLDVTLRYPFGMGPLQASAGLTVKRLKGEVLIDDSGNPPPSRQRYDETVPELHGQLRWPLARWLVASTTVQGISYDGNSVLEWRAGGEVLLGPLRLEAGWQSKRYEVNLTDYALDAQLDGALARIGFVFR